MKIKLTINGFQKELDILPGDMLVDTLRSAGCTEVKLTGDKGWGYAALEARLAPLA